MNPAIAKHPDDLSRQTLLAGYLEQKGLRSTRQRSLIIDTFFSSGGHLSAEELLAKVRSQDPKVSVATIYRTMKLLTECGLAHARHFGDGQTRFDPGHDHDHVVCTTCGTIVEFDDVEFERWKTEIAARFGFQLTRHKLELYGLCHNCQTPGSKR